MDDESSDDGSTIITSDSSDSGSGDSSSSDSSDSSDSSGSSDSESESSSDSESSSNSGRSDSDSNSSDSTEGTTSSSSSKIYDEFVYEVRAIQNRLGRRAGTSFMESRRFRDFFGTSSAVAMILWNLLAEHGLLPHNGKIKHLLWALYFMKVYATESATCSVLGGSRGAIDPKTSRKWIWQFIRAIAELFSEVVSIKLIYLSILFHTMAHPQRLAYY